ncbi:hypothetical protein GCM10009807_15650 [Microbacterium lacus]|uniref:Uncharacterized protein n=1 Tax=Microbacterium lacus TaxID=415217 RepID=A0ABN2GJN2_9MICO
MPDSDAFPPQVGSAIVGYSGIYNADGGVGGEIRYVLGHLFGSAECSLCDITHSPVRRKPEWDRMVARVGLPIVLLHRNELDPALEDHQPGSRALSSSAPVCPWWTDRSSRRVSSPWMRLCWTVVSLGSCTTVGRGSRAHAQSAAEARGPAIHASSSR